MRGSQAAATEIADNAQPQTRSLDDERSIEHLAEKSDDPSGATTRRLVIPRLPLHRQEATRLLALAPKSRKLRRDGFSGQSRDRT